MWRIERDPERGRAAAAELKKLGVKGILIKAAEQGYITQVACKMPECFCPEELGGACHFEPVTSDSSDSKSDWMPTVEHFPVYRKDAGNETVDNVILDSRRRLSADPGGPSLGGHSRTLAQAAAISLDPTAEGSKTT